GDRRVAEGFGRAGVEVGPRHERQPPHGVQPLLRQARRREARGHTRHGAGSEEELGALGPFAAGQPPGLDRVTGHFGAPMNALNVIRITDLFSYWVGKAFAWLILALTFVVSIEVFKRYILNAPTAWIFDFNNMLYGTLFMMCGAYTLAAGGHVRADFVYIYMKPRGQTPLVHSECTDEESRRIAMEGAHAIDDAARHRSAVEHKNP